VPFNTETAVPVYREWPDRECVVIGELSFTATAVGGHDFTPRWIAKHVLAAGGNAGIVASANVVESDVVGLGPYGTNVLLIRTRYRVHVARIQP
jgi:hypothetical protein